MGRRIRSQLSAALLAAFLATGCGNLSNADLQFLAVLPDARLTMDPPQDDGQALEVATREDGLAVPLRPLAGARLTAGAINAFLRSLIDSIAKITTRQSPSERGAGRRVWGPFQVKGGGWAKLTMTLDPQAICPEATLASTQRYRFEIALSSAKKGAYDPVFSGVLQGEDFDASCGHLSFDVDASRKHGGDGTDLDPRLVHLAWVREDGREELRTTVEPRENRAGQLVDGAEYRFVREADQSGTFRFARREDVAGSGGAKEELLRVALQWKAGKSVTRADFRISDGDLVAPVTGTACYDARGALVLYEDTGHLRPAFHPGQEAQYCGGIAPAEVP